MKSENIKEFGVADPGYPAELEISAIIERRHEGARIAGGLTKSMSKRNIHLALTRSNLSLRRGGRIANA